MHDLSGGLWYYPTFEQRVLIILKRARSFKIPRQGMLAVHPRLSTLT